MLLTGLFCYTSALEKVINNYLQSAPLNTVPVEGLKIRGRGGCQKIVKGLLKAKVLILRLQYPGAWARVHPFTGSGLTQSSRMDFNKSTVACTKCYVPQNGSYSTPMDSILQLSKIKVPARIRSFFYFVFFRNTRYTSIDY